MYCVADLGSSAVSTEHLRVVPFRTSHHPGLVAISHQVLFRKLEDICDEDQLTQTRYHLIVPSLPGFTLSSPPTTEADFGFQDLVMIFGNLMKGLGFKSYIAQGGDVGSGVIDGLASQFDECKGGCQSESFFSPPSSPAFGKVLAIGHGTRRALPAYGVQPAEAIHPHPLSQISADART